MQRQLSLTNTHAPTFSDDTGNRVRFLYENPSSEFGWSFNFGVCESFGKTLNTRIHIEPYATKGSEEGNLNVIVSNFFDRVGMFRANIEEVVCVYWMIVRITVQRKNAYDTLMPAMACSIFSKNRTLACRFDTLLRDPDEDESSVLACCSSNMATVLPVAIGGKDERAHAIALLETLHEGLRLGHELATRTALDTYAIRKLN